MNTVDKGDIESSSDEKDHDLAILPPIEKAKANTDMDNDESDDMNDDYLHHLLRSLRNSTSESSLLNKGNKHKSM